MICEDASGSTQTLLFEDNHFILSVCKGGGGAKVESRPWVDLIFYSQIWTGGSEG